MLYTIRRTHFAALAVAAALAACNDDRTPPNTGPDDPFSPAVTAEGSDAAAPRASDRARMERLARRVAQALADAEFRAYVKAELDRSPVVEHKLQFQRFVDRPDRRAVQAMARANGEKEDDILADARSAIGLEMYIPVPEHQAAWKGDENLLVATAMADRDAPVAFDLRGQRQVLSPDEPPATPVLAIVPQETNFDATSAMYWGTFWPSVTVGAISPTPGLYLTKSYFVNDFEGWLKGKPEFEIHVLGQAGTSDAMTSYQCVGEHAPPGYYWDQNYLNWSGSALIFTQQQLDTYKAQHPNQNMRIFVVEDDDTACQIKTNATKFTTLIKTVETYYPQLTGGKDGASGLQKLWIRANALQKILKEAYSWIVSGDDLVGNAVEGAVAGLAYPGMNWVVKGDNNKTNGWLNLIMK